MNLIKDKMIQKLQRESNIKEEEDNLIQQTAKLAKQTLKKVENLTL